MPGVSGARWIAKAGGTLFSALPLQLLQGDAVIFVSSLPAVTSATLFVQKIEPGSEEIAQ